MMNHSASIWIPIDKIKEIPEFEQLNSLFEAKLNEIEKRGKTGRLWILYYKMVSLLKNL